MSYLVAFWNLENLFAPEGYPGREPWLAKALRRELAGWTEALFRRKIDQLAAIIRQMKAGAGPDILGVCEVENAFALQALAELLPQVPFAWVEFKVGQMGVCVLDRESLVEHHGAFAHEAAKRP